jgi:hypothetical protein
MGPLDTPRTKHISVAYHFVRESCLRQEIEFVACKTGYGPITLPLRVWVVIGSLQAGNRFVCFAVHGRKG